MYQIVKSALVLLLNFALTLVNRENTEKAVKITFYINAVISVLFMIDFYFTQISGSFNYRLLWLSSIHLANLGVYFALNLIKGIDFKKQSDMFLRGYSIVYAASFITLFVRAAGNGATYNAALGEGSLWFIKLLINKPYEWSIWYVVIGNCVFFIPLPFLLKTTFKKISAPVMLVFGLALPLMIEGYQHIFQCGDVDIDDVVLNISGYLAGMLLLLIQTKIKKN